MTSLSNTLSPKYRLFLFSRRDAETQNTFISHAEAQSTFISHAEAQSVTQSVTQSCHP